MTGKDLDQMTEAELVEELRKALREAADAVADLRKALDKKRKK